MQNKFTMAGVMGWPVEHSRSPVIHNHWLREYNITGAYGLFPVEPKQLGVAISGLRALGLAGCNLTIPHKVSAMQYVDWIDPIAKRIGAINTIVIDSSGQLCGYNNDGFGYLHSLYEVNPAWKANHGPIVVLGAGGAARAILVSLLDAGAKEIRLINRTLDKADALAQEFGAVITTYDWSLRHEALQGCSLLVNTTSLGMHGQDSLDIELHDLPQEALVSDIIYAPLQTQLLKTAQAKGNMTINGIGMLLHQARPAFKAWFGVMPEVSNELKKILKETF